MITYVDKDHALDYQDLFRDAEDVLLHDDSFKAELLNTINNADLEAFLSLDEAEFEAALAQKFENKESIIITTLNDYFAFLPALLNILEASTDEKLTLIRDKFVRLPLSEPFVEINAETRAVSIPTDFARYGVGVQGDTYAETLYFAIDRFYDIADLASDDLKIIIQWEFKDATGTTVSGISKNSTKEVISIDGKQKVIFGWVIKNELTQNATTIRFAVRFYSLDDNDNLNYSFSSLPAEVSIKSTLVANLDDVPVEDNEREEVMRRLVSSKVYDNNYANPGEPTFTTALSVEGYDEIPAVGVDLAPATDSLILYAAGERLGGEGGRLDYVWHRYAPIAGGEFDSHIDQEFAPTESIIYIQLAEDEEPNENVIYYANSDGTNPYARGAVTLEEGQFVDTEHNVDIPAPYKQVHAIEIEAAGIYTVDLKSSNIYNNVNKLEMQAAEGIHVPGPQAATVAVPDNTYENITIEDEKPLIHLTTTNAVDNKVTLAITASVDDRPDVISYEWRKLNGELWIPIEDSNAATLEVDLPEDTTNFEDIYSVSVTTERNKVETHNNYPATYRVTNDPVAPIFTGIYNTAETKTYFSKVSGSQGTYRTLNVTAALGENRTDLADPIYLWMFREATLEEMDSPEFSLVPDTDGQLGIADVAEQPHDIVLTPNVADFNAENKLIFTDIAETASNSSYQLKPTDKSGLYYCIAINKLNNCYSATVCPYKYKVG